MTVENIKKYRYHHMPYAEKGMAIGLFGGSFNPPHEGHALVAYTALRRLKLDRIWWMVTPQNPLKNSNILAPLEKRLAASKTLVYNPRICITGFEQEIQTRYSAETIQSILKYNTGVHFIWIMGADNLATFHHWQEWRKIVHSLPIAIVDRPGFTKAEQSSKMARTFADFRIQENLAALLSSKVAPVWTFIHGHRSSQSSTTLREKSIKEVNQSRKRSEDALHETT
ncbi:MAG: nicotinate-nucleotide adenylyltransferase [Candidatus Tokpelaia sp. JSC161]|nr:MAG: nicotinate-nucleotide adenylyltransferase [Candidatus Tokpelaia sp. JSC161]